MVCPAEYNDEGARHSEDALDLFDLREGACVVSEDGCADPDIFCGLVGGDEDVGSERGGVGRFRG